VPVPVPRRSGPRTISPGRSFPMPRTHQDISNPAPAARPRRVGPSGLSASTCQARLPRSAAALRGSTADTRNTPLPSKPCVPRPPIRGYRSLPGARCRSPLAAAAETPFRSPSAPCKPTNTIPSTHPSPTNARRSEHAAPDAGAHAPRPADHAAAKPRRQRHHSPNFGRNRALCEPAHLPHPSPGRPRRRTAQILSRTASDHSRGPNCVFPILSRELFMNQGHICDVSESSRDPAAKPHLK
jgi:hypothetical protein